MSDVGTIILEHVCPAIGVVLATQMFLAPFKDVQKAIRNGSLGELNPLPWVFMLGNCMGWILYSFLTRNFYLFAGNITGLLLSIWFNLSASKLLFKQQVAQLPDKIHIIDEKEDDQSGDTAQDVTDHNGRQLSDLSAIQEGDNEEITGKGSVVDKDLMPPKELVDIEKGDARHKKSDDTVGGYGSIKDSASSSAYDDADNARATSKLLPPPITELPVFYQAPVHDYRVMGMALLWMTVFSILGFAQSLDRNTQELIVGTVTNFCLVFFYGAPLSCIAIILRTKNTATLHVPTMLTNTASSVFWGVYGLAVLDFFVAVPNVLGALLGFAQIVLYMIYPRLETTTVPVITAAIPAPGATIGADGQPTEMEVVQVQMHDVGSEDLLGHSGLLGNTNAADPAHNPMNMAYAMAVSSLANDSVRSSSHESGGVASNVTILHKQEIEMGGVTGAVTENPLVLQYASVGGTPEIPSPASIGGGTSQLDERGSHFHRRVGSGGSGGTGGGLHRRMGSRGEPGRRLEALCGGGVAPSSMSSSVAPTQAMVASVHHKRVISNSDTSFFAGLFAKDSDVLNLEPTSTATLHRRIKSTASALDLNMNEHQD